VTPVAVRVVIVGATDRRYATNAAQSNFIFIESQLVEEDEREQIEEELIRQQFRGEMGQVAHAEVMDDDGS
jgi:hypothetical protein